jgi:acyl-CoA thioesterase-1
VTDSRGLDQGSERWLQYTPVDKLYGYLPGIPDALPAVFGLTPTEYETILDRFARRADAAASDLLTDPAFAAHVDALPFQAGQTVLAVGDSITDDFQSWAEILRHVLRRRRPDLDVQLVNQGLSAHNLDHAAAPPPRNPGRAPPRLGAVPAGRQRRHPHRTRTRPTAGGAFRHDRQPAADARTRPPTALAVAHPRPGARGPDRGQPGLPFRQQHVAQRRHPCPCRGDAPTRRPPLVDLLATFGVPADPTLQDEDGVHPSMAGQVAITAAWSNGSPTAEPHHNETEDAPCAT